MIFAFYGQYFLLLKQMDTSNETDKPADKSGVSDQMTLKQFLEKKP